MAIVAAALACAPALGTDRADTYDWRSSRAVEADFDRNGQVDSAQLAIASDRVGLRTTINSIPMPIIDIPIDGSKQFGICPGTKPSIRLVAQSDAPFNALGETPPGYEICEGCIEIVVSGGECDPLHFYWDVTARRFAWWRA